MTLPLVAVDGPMLLGTFDVVPIRQPQAANQQPHAACANSVLQSTFEVGDVAPADVGPLGKVRLNQATGVRQMATGDVLGILRPAALAGTQM